MRHLVLLAALTAAMSCKAPATPTDPGATTPLADLPDLDEDGVPDDWETAGYYVEGGQLREWRGETDVVVFRTDPTRISTDQDPYPDGMEATGIGMPPTVVSPGNHPLVPAFPNIVAVLEGYEVTPTTEITLSTGEEVSQTQSIARETEQSTATTQATESSFSIEGSATVTVDESGVSGTVAATVGSGYQASSGTTEGTRTARTVGVDTERRREWSRATATNTAAAAELTLFVRYQNVGTDTAFDVVPTLSLRIGGSDVATFQPNTQINVLAPGDQHPTGIADAVEVTATGVRLTLSLADLALIEGGAPVTLVVTQLDANVVRREDDGTFDQQSWTGYGGAIGAVSSRLLFDDRDGFQREVLVYADDDASSPAITLGQALALAGVRSDGSGGLEVELESVTGETRAASLADWRFAFDDGLWTSIGDAVYQPGFNPYEVRMIPGTVVRMHPQPTSTSTEIYRTWWDDGQLYVTVLDSTYAASLLTVEGSIVGGGGVTFEWDSTQKAFRSTNLNGLGFLYQSPIVITARNPAAVAAGEDPVVARVPSTSPLLRNQALIPGLDLNPGFQETGSTARISGALSFGNTLGLLSDHGNQYDYATGLSLRAFSPNAQGAPHYFDNRNDGSEWCRVSLPDHPVDAISPVDLDTCPEWRGTYDNLPTNVLNVRADFPTSVSGGNNSVLVVRYCESGCSLPDRMAVARTSMLTAGLDVDWVVYRLR